MLARSNSVVRPSARGRHVLVLLSTVAILAGCNPVGTADNLTRLRGPAAEIDAADLAAFTTRQLQVAEELSRLAGLPGPPATGSNDWALVVDAGIYYVDKVCDDYVNALERFNRERNSVKNGVALTGAAAAAAMGVLSASAEAIALTATAFGLATGLIDVGSQTVLYSIDPGALLDLLRRTQATYKNEVAARRDVYTSQAAALAAVRGYLNLCMPATLATTVNAAVATANVRAVATDKDNPVPDVAVRAVTAPQGRVAPLAPEQPLPPPTPLAPEDRVGGGRSAAENALDKRQGRLVQQALCVSPDAVFGDTTRSAIALMRRANGIPAGDARLDDPLNDVEVGQLLALGPCDPAAYRTIYERVVLATPDSVSALQAGLAARTGGGLPTTGVLDARTRDAIRAVLNDSGLPDGDAVTPELMDRLAV